MKLFAKILALLALISIFGSASAQAVEYNVTSPTRKVNLSNLSTLTIQETDEVRVGTLVATYNKRGYVAELNGQPMSLEVVGDVATVKMGELAITIHGAIDGYWHTKVDIWVDRPVTTSFGDRGIARMYYSGMVPGGGRKYWEELWLNGRLFAKSITVIDRDDRIIWSRQTDQEGTLFFSRK